MPQALRNYMWSLSGSLQGSRKDDKQQKQRRKYEGQMITLHPSKYRPAPSLSSPWQGNMVTMHQPAKPNLNKNQTTGIFCFSIKQLNFHWLTQLYSMKHSFVQQTFI